MRCRILLLLIGLLSLLPTYSQNVDYNSIEELIGDIKNRNFEKPILYMSQYLASVENGSEVFQDSIYIGMTTLLATTYTQNNQIHKADSLLSHSINFLLKNGKQSLLAYSLYVAYGGILSQLQNYTKASYYLEPALMFVKGQEGKRENYSVIMSMLAICHMNMEDLERAQNEIEESITNS